VEEKAPKSHSERKNKFRENRNQKHVEEEEDVADDNDEEETTGHQIDINAYVDMGIDDDEVEEAQKPTAKVQEVKVDHDSDDEDEEVAPTNTQEYNYARSNSEAQEEVIRVTVEREQLRIILLTKEEEILKLKENLSNLNHKVHFMEKEHKEEASKNSRGQSNSRAIENLKLESLKMETELKRTKAELTKQKRLNHELEVST
jgi:hypothetical protein